MGPTHNSLITFESDGKQYIEYYDEKSNLFQRIINLKVLLEKLHEIKKIMLVRKEDKGSSFRKQGGDSAGSSAKPLILPWI